MVNTKFNTIFVFPLLTINAEFQFLSINLRFSLPLLFQPHVTSRTTIYHHLQLFISHTFTQLFGHTFQVPRPGTNGKVAQTGKRMGWKGPQPIKNNNEETAKNKEQPKSCQPTNQPTNPQTHRPTTTTKNNKHNNRWMVIMVIMVMMVMMMLVVPTPPPPPPDKKKQRWQGRRRRRRRRQQQQQQQQQQQKQRWPDHGVGGCCGLIPNHHVHCFLKGHFISNTILDMKSAAAPSDSHKFQAKPLMDELYIAILYTPSGS